MVLAAQASPNRLTVTLLQGMRRPSSPAGTVRSWEVEDHHALLPARAVLLLINTEMAVLIKSAKRTV